MEKASSKSVFRPATINGFQSSLASTHLKVTKNPNKVSLRSSSSLLKAASLGAELLVYPTAIGSEPDFPDLDTSKAWQMIITSHAIANGLFIAAVNRVGFEGTITFYGTSFVAEPAGEVLVKASRSEEEVLVTTLDFRRFDFWRELFPLLHQRRPTTYGRLLKGVGEDMEE